MDVESLREHYALTLRHWVRCLEAHHEQALQFVDEPTYRVWRLFMSGSAHGFNVGWLNVYQALPARRAWAERPAAHTGRLVCLRGRCIMVGIKTLADTLTGARFLLGPYLVWLGLRAGPEALTAATLALLVAWITDVLDGPLARRDPRALHTWIGDHDLEADLVVALGVWIYLGLAAFLSPWLAAAYVLIVAAALYRFGSTHLAWGVQALPYGAMIWTAWRVVPPYGLLLVGWIALVVIATWPRFPQRVLPDFLAGMRDLSQRH